MRLRLLALLIAVAPVLVAPRGCGGADCAKLEAARDLACSLDPAGAACQAAKAAHEASCPPPPPSPEPTPVPTPTPGTPPTPEPSPTPEPTPPPTPPPTPTPDPDLPVRFPLSSARLYLNDKPYGSGFDSTPRIQGDPELCELLHGVRVNDCHMEAPPLLVGPVRARYETLVLGGARHGAPLPPRGLCPAWQFRAAGGQVQPCVDDHSALASCDHFGDPVDRDDPQTPTTGNTLETLRGFEGEPKVCGLQRDAHGPTAGFFAVAHGSGEIRACPPLDTGGENCGPWRPFDK